MKQQLLSIKALLRYFHLDTLLLLCALTLGLCLVLPHEPIPVPGRLNVYGVVTNTLAALPVLGCLLGYAQLGHREYLSVRGTGGALWPALAAQLLVVAVTAQIASAIGVYSLLRNTLVLVLLAQIFAQLFSQWVGALLMALAVMVNWILGIDMYGQARWWAWLMHSPADALSWYGVLGLGLVLLGVLGVRQLARSRRQLARRQVIR